MSALKTEGFDRNVEWRPFIDGDRVGYRVTRLDDGKVTFVYMNPSTSGDGEPDVFIYSGTANDPGQDSAEVYVCPDFEE